MTPPEVAPVLGALHKGAERFFGSAETVLEPVAVFERPYSTIVRLRVTTPSRTPYFAYTKIYKVRPCPPYETPRDPSQMVEEEFAATLRLREALAGRDGLTSPRPIASLPEYRAIVTEELDGLPLDRLLRAGPRQAGPTFDSIATRIGTWLRAYQDGAPREGIWSADANLTYLDDRLRHITPLLGEAVRDEALRLFDGFASRVPPGERLVPIHADLCPSNVLVTPSGGVAVLDFATAQTGTRYHDVAHLYMHLEFLGARYRLSLGPMQDALIAAFDRASAVREPLFRVMFLQHVICHVTQLVDRAGWRPRMFVQAQARWRWRSCLALPPLTMSPKLSRSRTARNAACSTSSR
jgi:hypothetical protein